MAADELGLQRMDEQGPFDRILQTEPSHRRDWAAIVIVAASIVLGLLLLILVLPPISILDDDDEAVFTGPVTAAIRDQMPPPPAGFEAVSALYDLSTPESVDGPARLTVDLSVPVDQGVRLFLFTYRDGRWLQLGEAMSVVSGSAAQGEVPFLPANIAVLRPAQQTRHVLGSLPAGAELDPRALTALTTLNPTGFAPAPDGSISGSPLPLPLDLQIGVVPTLGASTPQATEALNAILASPELRAAHVEAILNFVREGGFAGIDLDYRSVDPIRATAFAALVGELSAGLREEGHTLSLTLPLPVRRGEEWDTLGVAWEELAPLVAAIKLAPELGQDRYYGRVEEALAFLVPRVGSSKLLLTVGSLSRERGVDGLRTLTLTDALTLASAPLLQANSPVAPEATVRVVGQNLASETGATALHWDDTARAVAFSYVGLGGERTVWLANAFSEGFKLDLARRYQLGGVAVEDVSRQAGDADIWPALQQYAQTGEVELVKPNGSLLQPRWTASGGALEGDSGASVTWRAPPEDGTYTLTFIVSDGVALVGQELRVTVGSPPAGVSP